MENINIFIRALLVGLTASVTVGPVAILCIQRTLSKTYRSGIVSGLGVATADTFLATISYMFYSVLKNQIEQYSFILHIVGGIFVMCVGAYIFMQNPAVQMRKNRAGKSSLIQDYISIIGITLANFIMIVPYILAFFAVYQIPSFESFTSTGILHASLVVAGFASGASAWWIGVASLINLFRRHFRPRHLATINHVAGLLIALLGAYTVLSTLFQTWFK